MFADAWPSMAGQFRDVEVDAFAPIADAPPHPSRVPESMFAYGRELEKRSSEVAANAAVAVEAAIWAHMDFVAIHPFQEGNGKTARLVLNVLIMRDVTSPTRPLVFSSDQDGRERYMMCVQEYRQGRSGPFESLIADLLEDLVRREERRRSSLRVWRRVQFPRRKS